MEDWFLIVFVLIVRARPAGSFDQSIVTVEWNIAKTSQPGNYRIQVCCSLVWLVARVVLF